MGYNKHQTFYLRINWLSKAIKYHEKDSRFFSDEDNFMVFGIGKNMFMSLRFWMEATSLFEFDKQAKIHKLTKFGEVIAKLDKETSTNFTKILLHYHFVTEKEASKEKNHVFYWYFNLFEDVVSTKESMLVNLVEWSKEDKVTEKSLKSDIDVLVNLYAKSEQESPEDLKVSILARLGLVRQTGNSYYKMPLTEESYNLDAFFYILLRWKESGKELTIDSLTGDRCSIGRVFNFSRSDVISIVDNLIDNGYRIKIDKTNDINTIQIDDNRSSNEFLASLEKIT